MKQGRCSQIMDLLPAAKVPGAELALPGTFAPWNFRSLGLSLVIRYTIITCA